MKKTKWQEAKDIEIQSVEETGDYLYFTFKGKSYNVTYNIVKDRWSCDCYNGSNVGLNNKQICKHKTRAMMYMIEERNKEK